MKILMAQLLNERCYNLQMGISAFLWRLEASGPVGVGPYALLRLYLDGPAERRREVKRWGFIPSWVGRGGLDHLGLKPWPWVAAEKAASSRIFAHPLRYQRCLVPADRIFVGDGSGVWLEAADGQPLYVAGIWDGDCFAILTAESPASLIRRIGERMPVAVRGEDYGSWLSLDVTDAATIQSIIERRREDLREASAPPVA